MLELNYRDRAQKWDKEEDVEEIKHLLLREEPIENICLSGNTLGVSAAKTIGHYLTRHNTFKKLLWSDLFTGRVKAEIPPALKALCHGIIQSKSQITELDLSDNAFGPAGIIALEEFFKSSASDNLQILRFNNNGMGIDGGRVLASYLKECCQRCTKAGKKFTLKEFYAGRNRLENRGAKALSETFKLIGSLEIVSIPQNGIYHEGITALSEAFALNKGMKMINLNDNTATHLGAYSLAKALLKLTNLESLNVGDCLLKDKGATYVAKAFKLTDERALKELILSSNEITLKGGLEVINDLCNIDLETLDLNGNCFGQNGVGQIFKKLKEIAKPQIIKSLSEDEGTADEESDQSSYENISGGEADDYEDDYEDHHDNQNVHEDDDDENSAGDDIVVVDREKENQISSTLFGNFSNISLADPKGSNTLNSPGIFNFTKQPLTTPAQACETATNVAFNFGSTSQTCSNLFAAKDVRTDTSAKSAIIPPFSMNASTFKGFDNALPKIVSSPFSKAPQFIAHSQADNCVEVIEKFLVDSDLSQLAKCICSKNMTFPQLFQNYFSKISDADKVGELYYKICHGIRKDTLIEKDHSAYQLASEVVQAAVMSKKFTDNQLGSSLMIHLGLLKCEDKKFEKPKLDDLQEPLKALEYLSTKPFLTDFLKSSLKIFLLKDDAVLKAKYQNIIMEIVENLGA